MIVIVDDIRERISLCGLTTAQFMQLTGIIRLARGHHNSHVRAVATELHLSSHWILDSTDTSALQVTLADLNWEEVFVMTAVITDLLSAMAPARQRTLTEDILEGLDAAVESSLRIDNHFRSRRFH